MALFFDKDTEQSLYDMMREYPLKPTQALWLGPQSIKILTEPNGFQGKLPDKLVLEKTELGVTRT